jgi:hypothetical protein
MFYGDEAQIGRKSIVIPAKAVQPIGIVHGSRCWGIWLEDVREKREKPPHLLISTFHPDAWAILFRLSLKIEDEPGTAEKVAGILQAAKFNIVFNESVPSGYHHLTWNIIGEALELEEPLRDVIRQCPGLRSDKDVKHQPEWMRWVSTQFSPLMLRYARDLAARLREANKTLQFLHDRFVDKQTLLYDCAQLPHDLQDDRQLLEVVQCQWLQNFAAFSLFKGTQQPMALRYDADTWRLAPHEQSPADEASQASYDRWVTRGGFEQYPVVGIASFDHDEHYARIAMPKAGERLRIHVEYSWRKDAAPEKSAGLLHQAMTTIRKADLNIDSVQNSMSEVTGESEVGRMSFMCSRSAPVTKEERERLRERLGSLPHPTVQLTKDKVRVYPVSARRLFVSIRQDYADSKKGKKNLKDGLEKLVEAYGFELVTGLDADKVGGSMVERWITDKIKSSDAFLQLATTPMSPWLSHELGVAYGALDPIRGEQPIAVCIGSKELETYLNQVQGRGKGEFKQRSSASDILKKIEPTIRWLRSVVIGP